MGSCNRTLRNSSLDLNCFSLRPLRPSAASALALAVIADRDYFPAAFATFTSENRSASVFPPFTPSR
jgi:hypothetical protein